MKTSLSLLSKVELFTTLRQKLFVFVLLLFIFFISLFSHYLQYQKLIEFDDYITTALVQKQYKKNNAWVLKLQSTDGFSFYTTSKSDLKGLSGYKLDIRLFVKDLDFLSYLKGFYSPSIILSRHEFKQSRYQLIQKLDTIHDKEISSVFSALFLAGNIPISLREKLSTLGINHLLAISGFHLAVLSMVLFFILKLFYKPLQNRYFPYKNSHKDIAFVVFIILFFYMSYLEFVPSVLRAFSMSLFAYFLYDRGIKILSFSSMFIVIAFLIALWPKLLFSLGFFFSIFGVFFIFLFLHHFKDLKVWQSFILLHLWVYLAMIPIVHFFFGTFSYYQLLSPFLTMAFIVFYPLELFLHLLFNGDELDFILKFILDLDIKSVEIKFSFLVFIFYLGLSLLSIFSKKVFYLLLLFSLSSFTYCLYSMA